VIYYYVLHSSGPPQGARSMDGWETQLRRGVVELAVLAVVARDEIYGYRVVEQLRQLDGLGFTESTIYPVLTRLAGDGFLAVRSEPSPAGPPRRYYRLSASGQRRLRGLTDRWRTVSKSLAALLDSPQSSGAKS
jgi:PadR family transcriptional regulator